MADNLREALVTMIPRISYLLLLLLASPELWMIMWLPSTCCIVVPTLNGAERANPHAGRIGPPFLATRDESIRLCARIALASRV